VGREGRGPMTSDAKNLQGYNNNKPRGAEGVETTNTCVRPWKSKNIN
jgi:hypothetical protein